MLLTLATVAAVVTGLPTETLETRFRRHIDWITENSDLEYHGEPLPAFLEESLRGMQVMYYGMETVLEAEASGNGQAFVVEAIYDRFDDVIFLPEGEPVPDYVLVHEAVHYLQDIGGIFETLPCHNASEGLAYRLQKKWQDAHDDPNPRPDGFTILMHTMCPHNL